MVNIIYGSAYAPSVPSLRILALTLLTAFPVGVLIHGVFAHDRQKELVPLWGTGVVLNIALNLFLIPRQGIVGAATASLLSQIIVNSLIWIKMRKINYFSVADKLPLILLATFMMSVSILLLLQFNVNILIIVPIAVLAYFGSLAFSGESPLRQIREIARRV